MLVDNGFILRVQHYVPYLTKLGPFLIYVQAPPYPIERETSCNAMLFAAKSLTKAMLETR